MGKISMITMASVSAVGRHLYEMREIKCKNLPDEDPIFNASDPYIKAHLEDRSGTKISHSYTSCPKRGNEDPHWKVSAPTADRNWVIKEKFGQCKVGGSVPRTELGWFWSLRDDHATFHVNLEDFDPKDADDHLGSGEIKVNEIELGDHWIRDVNVGYGGTCSFKIRKTKGGCSATISPWDLPKRLIDNRRLMLNLDRVGDNQDGVLRNGQKASVHCQESWNSETQIRCIQGRIKLVATKEKKGCMKQPNSSSDDIFG